MKDCQPPKPSSEGMLFGPEKYKPDSLSEKRYWTYSDVQPSGLIQLPACGFTCDKANGWNWNASKGICEKASDPV